MPIEVLAAVLGVLLVGQCALLLYMVRKVRGIAYHVRTGAFLERIKLFRQVQALFALERFLDLGMWMPPMRGWAASPDFLLALARHVERRRPSMIVELGSGASTVVLARAAQIVGNGHVYSLEEDAAFAEQTRRDLKACGLGDWASVIDAPLDARPDASLGRPWYSLDGLPERGIDLFVVDGPSIHGDPLGRYPAGPVLLPRLNDGGAVFVDDADRPGEREIVERWMRAFPDLCREIVDCEKGCVVLHRDRSRSSIPDTSPERPHELEPLTGGVTGVRRRALRDGS